MLLDLDKINELVFSGGELHFALDPEKITKISGIYARLRTSQDIMKLVLVSDIIGQYKNTNDVSLIMPYIPYARQDRVANIGEPLSIRAFANIINSLNYNAIYVADPHSDVATALLNKCINILDEIEPLLEEIIPGYEERIVIAPDSGAYKKLSKKITKAPLIQCTKHRDTATGRLSNLQIHSDENLTGKDLIVVDDICDGGGTFLLLAEELKKKYQPKSLSLYVTHGIFSKGFDELKKYYEKIYTTDSFYKGETDEFVVVKKLVEG